MSTWFARCGFGVREGASGNPTHHMQDMQKGAHTHTHFPPLPPPTTGTLHTAFSANGKGAFVSYANHQSESRNVDVGCVWCVQFKEAHRHVHRGLASSNGLTNDLLTYALWDGKGTDEYGCCILPQRASAKQEEAGV